MLRATFYTAVVDPRCRPEDSSRAPISRGDVIPATASKQSPAPSRNSEESAVSFLPGSSSPGGAAVRGSEL